MVVQEYGMESLLVEEARSMNEEDRVERRAWLYLGLGLGLRFWLIK